MSGNGNEVLTFRALLQAMPMAAAIVRADDPDFTIVAVNAAYQQMMPSGRDLAEGTSLVEAVRCGETFFPRQARARLLASLRSTLSTGGNSCLEIEAADTQEPANAVTHALLEAAGGKALLLQTVQMPQPFETSRKTSRPDNASANITENLNHAAGSPQEISFDAALLTIFEGAATGIIVCEANGVVSAMNSASAAFLGREDKDLIGLELTSLLHPDSLASRQKQMLLLHAGVKTSFVFEARYQHPERVDVWATESVTMLRVKDKPAVIVSILEDITQRKQAERALLQTENLVAMGRLTASIAHELNNPLESVTNLLFLITQVAKLEEVRSYALLAEQELARVSKIATQTLRFYKPQSAPAPVHIADVIESVLTLFEGRLRREKVQVRRRFVAGAEPLTAYSGELRQVFVNLVGNALDAMSSPARLTIVVRPSRHWNSRATGVRVIVLDTGSGIPKALLEKVFEPFVTTKEASGTGLGLWITRDIVKRQGGVLRVRSNISGPTRGTCMSIFFPYERACAGTNAA